MKKTSRVVITGLGAVTPLGNEVDTTWLRIKNGESGAGVITRFEHNEEFPTRIACEVKDFDPLNFLEKKEARRFDRFTQYALKAADEAIAYAGLEDGSGFVKPERFGVIFGVV